MKILLVEDDLVDQMAFSRWITKELAACQLTTANSVSEVAALAPQGDFEVIVCDFNLPDGTVLDVAEILPPQQIICISGIRDPQKIEQIQAAGIALFLLKDNHLDYLNQLKRFIANWQHPPINTTPPPPPTGGPTLIQLDHLKRAFDHKPGPIRDIIQLFLDQTPQQLSKLHQALQTDDRQGTKDLAHRLKSSYKMMGLHAQVELLQGMEDHCFTDDAQPSHLLPAMQRLLSDSDLAYQQLHQALDNL